MAAPTIKASARPSDVRSWLKAEGLIPESQERGKFTQAHIRAYNKANGLKYRQGQHVQTVEVIAKPEKGRSVRRRVNIAQVRAAAEKAGVEVGKRGRVSQEVLAQFVLTDGQFDL